MRLFVACELIGCVVGVSLSCAGHWLGGFNFDTRGQEAVGVFLCSLFTGAFGALIGGLFAAFVNSAESIEKDSE